MDANKSDANRCAEGDLMEKSIFDPKALEYMDNHRTEEYDIGSVAGAVSFRQSLFIWRFKKQTGMTISEAFGECGMDYSGNFAKIFKELVGITPTAYRNQLK